jgi:hypothetical protein
MSILLTVPVFLQPTVPMTPRFEINFLVIVILQVFSFVLKF